MFCASPKPYCPAKARAMRSMMSLPVRARDSRVTTTSLKPPVSKPVTS